MKDRSSCSIASSSVGVAPRSPRAVALVWNPAAGHHSAAQLDGLCRSFRSRRCTVRRFDSRSFRLDDLGPEVDLICVSGGDGTLRTAIAGNSASAHPAPYCVFPTGTINLVAREVGYRANLDRFVPDVLGRGASRRHIAGRIGEDVFLCCASVGPDSHAVARVTPTLKKRLGRLAYPAALASLLWCWPRHRLTVAVDGAVHAAEAVFVLKGRYYAGPWVLDGEASLVRDRFRVLLLPRAGRRDVARLALFALFGRTFADPQWTRLDAQTVDIAGDTVLPIQADGDIVAQTPARLAVDPNPMIFM